MIHTGTSGSMVTNLYEKPDATYSITKCSDLLHMIAIVHFSKADVLSCADDQYSKPSGSTKYDYVSKNKSELSCIYNPVNDISFRQYM